MARYQYETSPRKIDYEKPRKKKQVSKNKTLKKQKVKKQVKSIKRSSLVFYVILAFAMFFTISYRNAIIDIKYAQIKNLKSDLANIQKENEQLEANVEQALNLKAVQEEAQGNLGMKTLSTDQIEYINLSKTDHIETRVDAEEEQNFFSKIMEFIKKTIK